MNIAAIDPGMAIDSNFPITYPALTINLVSVLALVVLIIFIVKLRKKVSKSLRFLIILALLVVIVGFALSVASDLRLDFFRFELWPEGFFENVLDNL